MKLCNFASLDPALRLRGIKGLAGASALDRATWHDFHADLNEVAPATEIAVRTLFGANENSELEVIPKIGVRVRRLPPTGSTEALATVRQQRRGQEYFRAAVINNSGGLCCVTRLGAREPLVASHICLGGVIPSTVSMCATALAFRGSMMPPSTAVSSRSTITCGFCFHRN